MKIVKLSNGKYAVKKSKFSNKFIDLEHHEYKWNRKSEFFNDCQGTLDECQEFVNIYDAKIVKYIK
jgi:hypothetical protein